MRIPTLLAGLLLALPLHAQQPAGTQALPGAAPDSPPPVKSGEVLEPDVTIIQRETETVYEYRLNGALYMVKVVPAQGAPYYLLDMDGDGTLESRRGELDPGVMVPHWMILRW
ncbi:MAG TPA: DUF2782 domain-containing protein [Gammaproteobacteria bacterium]